MSIYKEEHREDFHLIKWLKGLFGTRCNSYVTVDRRSASPEKVQCTLPMGHRSRHEGARKNGEKLSWAYGDNWLD